MGDNRIGMERTKGTLSSVVTSALSQYLGVRVHTLFQVSTSGALVAGLYEKRSTSNRFGARRFWP
jgi:hypothetical protein